MEFQQKNGLLDCIEYGTVPQEKVIDGTGMIDKRTIHWLLGQRYSEMIHLAKTATPYWK